MILGAPSFWRSLLVAVPLVSSGCSDLRLQRTTAGAAGDTTPDPATPPKPSAGPRGSKEAERAKAAMEEESFAQVRKGLRRLVTAEETFFAENGTYSEDSSLIGFRPVQNTTIRFLWVSRDGWAASGTHSGLPGRDCVVFVGQARAPPTTLKYVRHGREGVPVCDDSSRPTAPAASSSPPQPKPAPVALDTGSALDALSPTVAMKVDLRNLVYSQETYFATQGIYARRTAPLALQYLWHRDVSIKILAADAQSWAAKATHARLPGKSCVIWFGMTTSKPITDAQHRQGDRSGVPVCDD
jgi:hypothetical protein